MEYNVDELEYYMYTIVSIDNESASFSFIQMLYCIPHPPDSVSFIKRIIIIIHRIYIALYIKIDLKALNDIKNTRKNTDYYST